MIFHQPSNSLSSNNYNAYFYRGREWGYHFHKSLEIIYVIRGSVSCIVNNTEHTLFPGDFGLCLPYEIHSYKPEADALYWVCVFSADYVRVFAKQAEGKTGNGFGFRCSDAVERFVREKLIKGKMPSVNILKACLYAICGEYLENIELIEAKNGKTQPMTQIIDFVEKHHTENIGLADIAKLLGYDYHYVSRYFHSVFNMSFKEFLNVYRLETVVRLMEESDKKLIEIAYESGFQSVRSFNNCFRAHFGVSPTEYKKGLLR